jgi:uncharacterized membrane protein
MSVDPLRGFAMVLVVLQHSYLNVNMTLIPPLLDWLVWRVTHLAPIAFVSIAGAMFSYYLYLQSDWRAAYRRFAVRAAFILLVAHYGIGLTSYYSRVVRVPVPPWAHAFGSYVSGMVSDPIAPWVRVLLERYVLDVGITDLIGISLLVSPVLILGVGPVVRAVIIAVMLVGSPVVVGFVHPAGTAGLILKEALFGSVGEPSMFWYPLVPWIAIFVTGSFAGQALARFKQGSLDAATLIQKTTTAGIALAAPTLGYEMLRLGFGHHVGPDFYRALYPSHVTVLLPAYFAVLAWLFAFFMQRIDVAGTYHRPTWALSILGRTSLFAYVVQFAVVLSAPAVLGLTGSIGSAGFALLFVVGLVVVWPLCYAYGRLRGWFTKDDYEQCAAAARARQQASHA